MASESEFTRYRNVLCELVAEALGPISRAQAADDSLLVAVPAARLLTCDDPALYPALTQGVRILDRSGRLATGGETPRFVDPAGHHREIYTPLVLHLHLAAFSRCYERLPQPLWAACEDALPQALELARPVERFADIAPPPDRVALTLWQALCIAQFGQLTARDVDLELADSIVHAALAHHDALPPDAPAPLSPQSPDQAIETWTYDDLAGLHALANLALLRRNRDWTRRVARMALFHVEHTQPDHATTEPWAVFAFLWSPTTRPFADQLIHHAQTHPPHPISPLSAILLADAADALTRFET